MTEVPRSRRLPFADRLDVPRVALTPTEAAESLDNGGEARRALQPTEGDALDQREDVAPEGRVADELAYRLFAGCRIS